MLFFSPWFKNLAYTSLASIVVSTATAAEALDVQIKPLQPQLGDTISVVVTTQDPDSIPVVNFRDRDYPVFRLDSNNRYRVLLPTSPLDQPGKLVIRVTGDGKTSNLAVGLKNRFFPTQRIRLAPSKSGSATETELQQVAQFKSLVTPTKYWQGPFLRPNAGQISSVYGVRRYYNGVFAQDYYHRGVDYAGGYGSAVVAPAAGRVALIGKESEGFRVHGNTVGIDHGQGILSIFLHLSSIDVKPGDFVQAGQRIGAIGSTGASTGPHLHWGLYVHNIAVDPVPWRYEGIE